MGREYKIDVIVDDHGAVDTLKKVADAEDQVASSATKFGTTLETLSTKQQITVADTRGMDEAFGRLAVTERDADRFLSELHVTMQKLPSTFSVMRGGLNDVAVGAGLTVESLGLMGTAGTVMATAYAAWGIGTMLNDFLGLDKAIGSATQSVRDWVSGSQEMGARNDVLALASQRAGRAITDFSEALSVNAQWLEDWKRKAQDMDDVAARIRGPQESAKQINAWDTELEKVRSAGVLKAFTADIESHNFSHAQLAERYRVSVAAIALFQRELSSADAEVKQHSAYIDEMAKRVEDENRREAAAMAKQAAFEKEVFAEREQLYKKIQAEMQKTSEMYLKVTNDAVLAELAAKGRVNAANGLDINGAPAAIGQTPQAVAARAQHDLDQSAATSPGINTTSRQQEINDTFLKAVLADAQAADAEAAARGTATTATVTLSRAHMGAVAAADSMSSALSAFRGMLVGSPSGSSAAEMARNQPLAVGPAGIYTGDGVGIAMGGSAGQAGAQFTAAGIKAGLGLRSFDVGGPIAQDGPIMAHAGEMVVPKGGMLVSGGGGSAPVTIMIDAKGATFEDDRALDRLADKLQTRIGVRFAQRGG